MSYMDREKGCAMKYEVDMPPSNFAEFCRRSSSQNDDILNLQYKVASILSVFRGNTEDITSGLSEPANKSDTGSFGRAQELHNQRAELIASMSKMIDELGGLIG